MAVVKRQNTLILRTPFLSDTTLTHCIYSLVNGQDRHIKNQLVRVVLCMLNELLTDNLPPYSAPWIVLFMFRQLAITRPIMINTLTQLTTQQISSGLSSLVTAPTPKQAPEILQL